ncbi:MAG: energy-coupling factor transporter ATPase [Faecalibacterium sp.]|jgi:energy-coupling factor transporter ATPase|nr:energy-coupling factor transporter ATPase [Faecalibacterium sp.]
MSIIKVENVSYDYRRFEEEKLPAVRGVSFEIEEGEFVVIGGANGSGKSTLAKMLNGLLKPTCGKIEVLGMDVSNEEKVFEIRRNVGIVFQNPDNQTVASIVEDDVAFGPENLGVPREEIVSRVQWALKAVGMEEYAKSTPFKMSGGQKQRIAIAGILAMKPKIIVLDEATSMLDPNGRKEVMSVLKKLNEEENMTVIHITHHMEEAADADRILVMDGGKLVMDGAPREVFADGEKLKEHALSLPVAAELADMLRKAGLPVRESVLSEDELLEEIWRLK